MTALRRLATALVLGLAGLPAAAATPAEVATLFESMGLPGLVAIMREEGLGYGRDIGEGMLGAPSADWEERIAAIYDAERMERSLLGTLEAELQDYDLTVAQEFFAGDLGREIVSLELAAREALLDEAVESAAKEMAALAMAEGTGRFRLVEDFARVNDLIETNVVGAMNADLAFYDGLGMGGALPAELTEDEILRDVWAREDEVRQNTTEWVYAFLMLAYEPLEDEEIEAYTGFSGTAEGRGLNRVLFLAFDRLFADISRAIGLEVAQEAGSARL